MVAIKNKAKYSYIAMHSLAVIKINFIISDIPYSPIVAEKMPSEGLAIGRYLLITQYSTIIPQIGPTVVGNILQSVVS